MRRPSGQDSGSWANRLQRNHSPFASQLFPSTFPISSLPRGRRGHSPSALCLISRMLKLRVAKTKLLAASAPTSDVCPISLVGLNKFVNACNQPWPNMHRPLKAHPGRPETRSLPARARTGTRSKLRNRAWRALAGARRLTPRILGMLGIPGSAPSKLAMMGMVADLAVN